MMRHSILLTLFASVTMMGCKTHSQSELQGIKKDRRTYSFSAVKKRSFKSQSIEELMRCEFQETYLNFPKVNLETSPAVRDYLNSFAKIHATLSDYIEQLECAAKEHITVHERISQRFSHSHGMAKLYREMAKKIQTSQVPRIINLQKSLKQLRDLHAPQSQYSKDIAQHANVLEDLENAVVEGSPLFLEVDAAETDRYIKAFLNSHSQYAKLMDRISVEISFASLNFHDFTKVTPLAYYRHRMDFIPASLHEYIDYKSTKVGHNTLRFGHMSSGLLVNCGMMQQIEEQTGTDHASWGSIEDLPVLDWMLSGNDQKRTPIKISIFWSGKGSTATKYVNHRHEWQVPYIYKNRFYQTISKSEINKAGWLQMNRSTKRDLKRK